MILYEDIDQNHFGILYFENLLQYFQSMDLNENCICTLNKICTQGLTYSQFLFYSLAQEKSNFTSTIIFPKLLSYTYV
jgi:hypothetical protein